MKLRMIAVIAVTPLFFFIPLLANATCTASIYYPTLADGRLINNTYFAPAAGEIVVFARVTGGHSYSAEITDPFDPLGGPANPLYFNLVDSGICSEADTGATFVDTTFSIDPGLYSGRRVSFIPSIPQYAYAVIKNTDSAGHNYRVTFTDTTEYNVRWSTFGGFTTQWGFQNTTNLAVTGTLTVMDSVSGGPYVKSISIPPGASVFVQTTDSFVGGPIPGNHVGGATFAVLGPPGSIKADCYFVNGTIIVPAEFKSVRELGH